QRDPLRAAGHADPGGGTSEGRRAAHRGARSWSGDRDGRPTADLRQVLPRSKRGWHSRLGSGARDRAIARDAPRRHPRVRRQSGRRSGVRDGAAGRVVKVLMVDDEPDVRALVRSALSYARQDLTAVEAADGDEALAMIHSERPDLVVLDLALPKRDGFAVLEQVREKTDLPIIVLTARGLEEDKIKGLRLGADDYLTKPFSPRELVARIESVLRRSAPRAPRSGTIDTHDLAIDLTARRVRRAGKDIHFTPTEFNLLAELARQRGA